MQSATIFKGAERPSRLGLAMAAMVLAVGLVSATNSFAQSATSPSNASATTNRAVAPQAPNAIQNNAKATQKTGQASEQKAEDGTNQVKDKTKSKTKDKAGATQ